MVNDKLIESIKNVELDAENVNEILDSIVSAYSSDLDELMDKIQTDVIQDVSPAIITIEKYFAELSSALYYMCTKTEKLGVFDSISRAKAQETYNNKYLEHQFSNAGKTGAKKPTVAESTATAENEALYDKTVNDIYSRAYKILKNKVGAAETMVSTLSKILSHRIQESSMIASQTERKILNEDNVF